MKPLSLVSIIIIAVAVLATAGFLVWQNQQTVLQIVAPSVSPGVPTSVDAEQNIANANDCIKAGYPSVQTVPGIQECRTPGGKRFKWHFTADDLIIAAYEDLGGKIISIDSKKIVDDIVKGLYADDEPTRIVEYTNAWGGIAYGVTFRHEDINKYMRPTEFVRNPRIYWEDN